jgi:N-acetylmuramoyl-L-alanine amidase
MNVGRNNRMVVGRRDGLAFRFVKSPNIAPGRVNHQFLVIHATEGQHVQSAVNTFLSVSGGRSIHLILGRDGKELVQMADFDARAQHANEFNTRSIGIELDNTGLLREDPSVQGHFSHISRFQPGEYLYGIALNDRGQTPVKLRPWMRYSKEQMEALVLIARLLVEKYNVQIVGHEEIKSFKLDPGPAFPMARFREIMNEKPDGTILYDEVSQDVELRTGPGMIYPPLPGGRLKAGTPVVSTSDHDGWAMVDVMAEVDGDRWLVGWTPLETIAAKQATPVVKNHKLFTTDGRQYPFISPHPNNFDANRRLIQPKYVVLHSTDGLVMESTINSFRDGSHGASAHLLIGRDGRVVQFVDFDRVAFHCGFSYWEEDVGLNDFSIGIELDNGGFLSRSDGVWKWKTTIIPDDDVAEAKHWKEFSRRGWHKYTKAQLDVAQQVVAALKEAYGIQVALGHDTINLAERGDPGPLFPIAEFQALLAGAPGVHVKVYHSKAGTDLYKVTRQKSPTAGYPKPPDLNHPQHGKLPAKTRVKIIDVQEDWTRVKVSGDSGAFKGTEGWIKSGAVRPNRGNTKTTQDSQYFMLNPRERDRAPRSFSRHSPLPAARLRVERFEGDFALIATLEPVNDAYIEGWVKKEDITLAGLEQVIYPPPTVFRRRRGRRT